MLSRFTWVLCCKFREAARSAARRAVTLHAVSLLTSGGAWNPRLCCVCLIPIEALQEGLRNEYMDRERKGQEMDRKDMMRQKRRRD